MPAPLATLLRAFVIWLVMMAVESAQGALRRLFFSDVLFVARQVGVAVSVVIIILIAWFAVPWMRLRSAYSAFGVGLLWTVLTVGFEIGFGRAIGLEWPRLLSDYDLTRGGLMPLGLMAMALTPCIVWLIRKPAAG